MTQLDFELVFGAMAEPIKSQLSREGLRAKDPKNVAHWQKDADAIARLSIRMLLPPSAVQEARQKLMNRISKNVEIKP